MNENGYLKRECHSKTVIQVETFSFITKNSTKHFRMEIYWASPKISSAYHCQISNSLKQEVEKKRVGINYVIKHWSQTVPVVKEILRYVTLTYFASVSEYLWQTVAGITTWWFSDSTSYIDMHKYRLLHLKRSLSDSPPPSRCMFHSENRP